MLIFWLIWLEKNISTVYIERVNKLLLGGSVVLAVLLNIVLSGRVFAGSESLILTQIQIGNVSSSRLIEVYNPLETAVDITDWCLERTSATELTREKVICFQGYDGMHLFVAPKSHFLVASSQLLLSADFSTNVTLGTNSGGHVYLLDSDNRVVDRVGWNKLADPNGNFILLTGAQNIIERQIDETGVYIDTDTDQNDWFVSVLRQEYLIGAIEDVPDICPVAPGFQTEVPTGYYIDESGDCAIERVSVCPNLDGFWEVVPDGYGLDGDGNCQIDICLNIAGWQGVLPANMYQDDESLCWLDLPGLLISELLPNAEGSDEGNEYIEIYNPSDRAASLGDYVLIVDAKKIYFDSSLIIPAGGYYVVKNSTHPFTLLNSSSQVWLETIESRPVDMIEPYFSPPEAQSWQRFDGAWQYSNQPSPGEANLPFLIIQPVSVLAPCPEGQERNPETNRCRNIVVAVALKPCKDGQYRSEETGRCRNIVDDIIEYAPCPDGQERNPETNRCRKIVDVLGASALADCPEGQERNPETNRCRKIVSAMPEADFAPYLTYSSSNNHIAIWSLAGLTASGSLYAAWEWRDVASRLIGRFRRKK
jgi:hypothetical protein